MVDELEPRSPLHDLAMPDTFAVGHDKAMGVTIEDRLPGSLVQVQSWPETMGKVEKAVTKVAGKDDRIMPTGPGRWLVESDEGGLEDRLREVIDTKTGAVTDLTHARVAVTVSGEKATWILASGYAIDFSLAAFPIGATRVTNHHEIGATITRNGEDSFDLYVFTSFARGFWHWLTNTAKEVGYRVL